MTRVTTSLATRFVQRVGARRTARATSARRFLAALITMTSVVAGLSAVGCVSTQQGPREMLRTRGAFDLGCSLPAMSVAQVGGGRWVAQGCGEEAHYVCTSAQDCLRVDKPASTRRAAVASRPAAVVASPPREPPAPAVTPRYGDQCQGLEPTLYDVRVDRGIGPISIGMTRDEVERLGLLRRAPDGDSSNDTVYYGPLYVVFQRDLVVSVQYHVGCEGGGVRLPDGSLVHKGTSFAPYVKGLPSCFTDHQVAEGGSGDTYRCGSGRTLLDLIGGCKRVDEDGSCEDWGGRRDMIRVLIADWPL